jgi:hypothetical protein
MTTLKTSPRKARSKTQAASLERSPWDQLQAFLAAEPFDSMFSSRHPEIPEAFALIKYGSPEPSRVEPLTIALRLLVDVTMKIADEIQYFEPGLVKACNLLHEHLADVCGLTPSGGRWTQEN